MLSTSARRLLAQGANCIAAGILLSRFREGNDYIGLVCNLPGFEVPHSDFEEAVQAACDEYAAAALPASERIFKEIEMYKAGVNVLEADAESVVHATLLELRRGLKKLHAEQQGLPSLDTVRAPTLEALEEFKALLTKVVGLKSAVQAARVNLGALEAETREQAEHMLDLLDTELRQQFANKEAIDNAFFEKVEAMDTNVTLSMVESAEAIMAEILSDKPPPGASDEQLQIMSDREAFVGSIKESSGHRLTQLNKLWDACRKQHAKLFKTHIDAAVASETNRSRAFLHQCDSIKSSLLSQVDELQADLEAEVSAAQERRSSVQAGRNRE